MDLERRFGFRSGCLFIRAFGVCVASDLHIGLEDELWRQGLTFPLDEERMLTSRLEEVLDEFRPSIFVLAGDILHSFSRMGRAVADEFESIMSMLEEKCDVILLKGSHDTMLSVLRESPLERYDLEGFTIAHGHDNIDYHGDLVMGHEHPVIQIEMERLPCFLFGRSVINGEDLMVLPAFNPLCQGITINRAEGGDMLSPLLREVNVEQLCPIVEVEGEVLIFPRLQELRRHID
jgi:putative SbcD/Mre11-related phosphoesterase